MQAHLYHDKQLGGLMQWAWLMREAGSILIESQRFQTRPYSVCGQLVLANVPIVGWNNGPYEHSLLDRSSNGIWLSTLNEEIFQFGWWPEELAWSSMVKGALRFPLTFPKRSCRFPYVLLITLRPIVFLPVHYFTILCDIVSVLQSH